MAMQLMKKIFHSSDLDGTKGDDGEEWCVFFRNWKNPIDSCWTWCRTEQEAKSLDPFVVPEGNMERMHG